MMGFGIRPRLRVMSGNRIDTDRLVLRAPGLDDAPHISRFLGNWEVSRWLVRIPFPYRVDHARAWVERSREERAAGIGWPFLVTLRDDNRIIGGIDLTIEDDRTGGAPGNKAAGALGYWLGKDYWGRGYATEAAAAMVRFAFEILSLDRVTASALPDNARSLHVIRKIGLTYVDRRPEETIEHGSVDTDFYALDRRAWQARR
jgi:RimJ/RimL family protein N-acetyltransferase